MSNGRDSLGYANRTLQPDELTDDLEVRHGQLHSMDQSSDHDEVPK